ncbi:MULTISPECIES: sensor domain-containing diguanylate cyclase [Vibrio]|nr:MULTISPECIES: diguanylate cyclase [Vibrio]MBN8105404.1 diguanylate cyclase [Vibrio vulnificus]WOO28094.1 diguanylate cyclase [Vibrio parahaemolyticus]
MLEKNIFSKQLVFIILSSLLIFLAFFLWRVSLDYTQQKERILQSSSYEFQAKVKSSLATYKLFSQYIYRDIISNNDVLKIMEDAYNVKDKETYRDKLLSIVKNKYSLLKKSNFRQLHFHFPNGDSFLRVHQPDKYGDNLLSIRESIRLANERKEFVEGFEEGRIFNGYRFVYPIFKAGKFLGTMEVSLSMSSIIDVLSGLYTDFDFYFLIKKDVVDSSVFESMKENYSLSTLSDNYYYDKQVHNKFNENRNFPELLDDLKTLSKELQPRINTESNFSFSLSTDTSYYILNFLSIINIKGEHVAYLIATHKDHLIQDMQSDYEKFAAFTIVIFILYSWFFYRNHQYSIKLKTLSSLDYLTKSFNRHRFMEFLSYEYERFLRNGEKYSIVMIDVDYFKSINDQFGHTVGDKYLLELTNLIKSRLRKSDIFARWGGEEFIILLPETSVNQALILTESLRVNIKKHQFTGKKPITISLGISEVLKSDEGMEIVIDRADRALYQAKKTGRDKVVLWNDVIH